MYHCTKYVASKASEQVAMGINEQKYKFVVPTLILKTSKLLQEIISKGRTSKNGTSKMQVSKLLKATPRRSLQSVTTKKDRPEHPKNDNTFMVGPYTKGLNKSFKNIFN